MFLSKLVLKNFRLFENIEIDFHPAVNIIHGLNAQGKTTLLEAIYYLAITKSFRSGNDAVAVNNSASFFDITGSLFDGVDRTTKLRLFYSSKDGKHAFLNNQKIKAFSELIGYIPVTLLSLEDLDITYGVPSSRRRFADILLSQVSKEYLINLQNYKRVVNQKNKLLNSEDKRLIDKELYLWNQQMSAYGSEILKSRLELVQYLNEGIGEYYRKISSKDENIKIIYNSTVKTDGEFSANNLAENFTKALADNEQSERKNARAAIGPHRDDIEFLKEGKPIKSFGSQGENKTFLIALKLLENEFISDSKKKTAIFLMDDVFGELDDNRIKNFLINFNSSGQTFITTTSKQSFYARLGNEAKMIKLADKKIFYEA